MAMVNMKSKPGEKSPEATQSTEYKEPEYPYGLCIRLSKDELDKLGITSLPTVGAKMTITAAAFVKSTSAYETQDSGKDMSIELQITDMEIGAAQAKGEAATMLYGD
jgi:hypothetical protein